LGIAILLLVAVPIVQALIFLLLYAEFGTIRHQEAAHYAMRKTSRERFPEISLIAGYHNKAAVSGKWLEILNKIMESTWLEPSMP